MRLFGGSEAQRAGSTKTGTGGDLSTTTEGYAYVSDGVTLLGSLKKLARWDEMAAYVISILNMSAPQPLPTESGYVYVLLDSNGRVALGVKPDGTVIAKLQLAAGTVDYAQLSVALNGVLPTALPAESGYIYALTGSGGRAVLLVQPDGTVTIPKFTIAAGAVAFNQLATSVSAVLPAVLPAESGYVWAVLDTNGRVLLGIDPTGNIVGKVIPADGAVTYAKLASAVQARLNPAVFSRDYAETVGVSPSRSVWMNRDLGATRSQVSAVGVDSYNPAFIRDLDVVAFDTAAGRMWVPASGGTPHPVLPAVTDIACYGDSLTNGQSSFGSSPSPFEPTLASALGVTVNNRGIQAQMSADIALRQGGINAVVTLSGNQIPADTSSVTVTSIVGSNGSVSFHTTLTAGLTPTWTWAGTLAGVPGTLTRVFDGSGASTLTFARTTGGAVVACPPGSVFVPTGTSGTDEGKCQILWSGRNNLSTGGLMSDVTLDTASMVAFLKTYVRRYLVLSITNSGTEPVGTANYTSVIAENAALAAAHGNHYIDLRGYLIAHGLADAGITPTSQDTTDIANDVIPTSLRAVLSDTTIDPVHFNPACYAVIGNYLAAQLRARGWYS